MDNLIILSLGEGNLSSGFPAVTVQLWDEHNPYPMKFTGSLPAASELSELYKHWQLLYLALYQRLEFNLRLDIEIADVTNVSEIEFGDLCQRLSHQLNHWLNSEQFQSVDQRLRTQLNSLDEVRFIIETKDDVLRRLPWHLWRFFDDYPKAEVALSTLDYQRLKKLPSTPASPEVKILAVFGNSQGIDIETDRAYLEQLSRHADIKFLVEPILEELNEQLWQDWDILFYAGHSSSSDSVGEKGLLQLNQTAHLTLEQLRYALKRAIAQGLKLAIFNSCDGLGLAQSLTDLHIPYVIVMREPVPDVVAQTFLRHFLIAFMGGQSLYASVREARERLQGLEDGYPCATWLPIICQNPAELPLSWRSLRKQVAEQNDELLRHSLPQPQPRPVAPAPRQNRRRPNITTAITIVLIISFLIASLVVGVRSLGVLQPFELQAFDRLMQLRPAEPIDNRFLIISIDDADLQYQEQMEMERKGSLSDQAFAQLLQTIEPYHPSVIASDIYHDFEFEPGLAAYLQQHEHIIGVCRISQAGDDSTRILPPPQFSAERLGFTNAVLDPDGVMRRQLLGMPSASYCPTSQSLSLRVATDYLKQLDIRSLQFTEEGTLQIEHVLFPRLEFNTGGYQLSPADANGYQVLLNYRSAPFTQVSLRHILDGSLDASQWVELFQDRIVLIGVTIDNVDSHLTPYRKGLMHTEMPGVVIQAHMTSQVISAVLNQRPLLWGLPQWLEVIWIWSWAWFGGALVAGYDRYPIQRHPRSKGAKRFLPFLVFTLCLALAILYGLCFVFLLRGGWVPLVPCALTLVATSACVAIRMKHIN